MLDYLWLIPVLPLLGFAVNGLVGLWSVSRTGRPQTKPFVYTVACGSVFLSLLLSLGCFWGYLWCLVSSSETQAKTQRSGIRRRIPAPGARPLRLRLTLPSTSSSRHMDTTMGLRRSILSQPSGCWPRAPSTRNERPKWSGFVMRRSATASR